MRLVLDTNVVMDWLLFADPAVAPIAQAIESGQAVVLTSASCAGELRRVLAYPEFHLDAAEQAALLERYGAQATLLEVAAQAPVGLPKCRDPDDQKFLLLAWQGEAQYLITRDKALLALGRAVARLGRFTVLTPDRFVAAAPVHLQRAAAVRPHR